jgi:cytochrome c oxidase assembly protein subunit 11
MNNNTRLLLILSLVALGMLGISYAFVPLYRIFCQAFGIPVPSILVGEEGVPKNPSSISKRRVTVRFQANNAQGMPVKLKPDVYRLKVNLGAPTLTAYTAENPTSRTINGVAVHTIFAMGGPSGVDINKYIDLQQCFCFERQIYPPSDTVNLPLSFTVTNDLPPGIHTITFGYTLFEDEDV